MESFNIEDWVKESADPATDEFRKAVHTLIAAISKSASLSSKMIIKGGILLAVRFKNERFTRDVDFSTDERYDKGKEVAIIEELKEGLIWMGESLDYGLDLRIQRAKLNPSRNDATFPTLEIKVGYAYRGSNKHKSLVRGNCPTVLAIDYSFNEANHKVDTLEVSGAGNIKAYSLPDLVGEKYRAIIQQKVRNRIRRQDAYDIYRLFEDGFLDDTDTFLKWEILTSLMIKSESRNIKIDKNTLDDEDIIRRSKAEYGSLKQEIQGELPPFDIVFSTVKRYYKSLPWPDN